MFILTLKINEDHLTLPHGGLLMEEYFQTFSQAIMASKNVLKHPAMGNDWHLYPVLRNP